jgi:predicted metal-binding membrane protein
LLKNERFYVLLGLGLLIVLSWAYLITWDMPMSADPSGWTAGQFFAIFAMWAVMMMAMMVPSALPMILFYSSAVKKARADGGNLAPVTVFLGGYLVVWTLFSLFAAALQWGLHQAALISPMMVSASIWLTSGLLVMAGLYQMSPLKDGCLRYCSNPVQFITRHWRTGTSGALKMGLRHGGYCVGCCWALMILLFVGGVMNLLWVAVLAIFVLLEKILPLPRRWPQISGALLIAGGLVFGFKGF